ncbi:MAG: Holliday junction resolvase RuvX [Patescibacteria group bacterium]
MRFLGIDYGTKRIGIAISDEYGRLAFPKKIVFNNLDTLKEIGKILNKEKVNEIVVGESVDFSGKLNILSAQIDFFIKDLEEKFKLPVRKQKEFLTSVEARRPKDGKIFVNQKQAHSRVKQKKSGHIDASAAALILQRYLDKINNGK